MLKSGTNTKKALEAVYSMMNWPGETPPADWNRTRHVIILMTDGQKELFSCPRFPSLSYEWGTVRSTCNTRLSHGWGSEYCSGPQAC